jgi:hypothetical protein
MEESASQCPACARAIQDEAPPAPEPGPPPVLEVPRLKADVADKPTAWARAAFWVGMVLGVGLVFWTGRSEARAALETGEFLGTLCLFLLIAVAWAVALGFALETVVGFFATVEKLADRYGDPTEEALARHVRRQGVHLGAPPGPSDDEARKKVQRWALRVAAVVTCAVTAVRLPLQPEEQANWLRDSLVEPSAVFLATTALALMLRLLSLGFEGMAALGNSPPEPPEDDEPPEDEGPEEYPPSADADSEDDAAYRPAHEERTRPPGY